ncbi:MAG: hypothetical protein ACKOX6_17290 [Bdellovibrio sp.]
MLKHFLLVVLFVFGVSAQAKTLKFLFVGNSLTYSPGDSSNPELPRQFSLIAENLGLDVSVDFIVKGGQTLRKHFETGQVAEKLRDNKYDYVVIQGYSIEALFLPVCFYNMGGPLGRPDFLKYTSELTQMIKDNGAIPVLFGTWTYQAMHPWLQEGFLCLRFSENESNAGEKWYGNDLYDFQRMLDEGYRQAGDANPDLKVKYLGKKWQQMMDDPKGVITDTKLYLPDHIHPAIHGTFFNALFFVHDLLEADLSSLKYKPTTLTSEEFEYFKNYLNR